MVPALNEGDYLPRLLADLSLLRISHEVLVVDGGSTDSTVAVAREAGARVLRTALGRSCQMNAGAAFLDTQWFLFLHADCRIGPEARTALERHVSPGGPTALEGVADRAAHFRFATSGKGAFFRALEAGQRARERLFGLVYGDQGLLIPKALFHEVGDFPDEPLMEDVLLNRRLASSQRLTRLEADLVTSPRRYLEEGRVVRVLRNFWNLVRFSLGTDPKIIARSYGPRNRGIPAGVEPKKDEANNTLLVFAKAPRVGSVKTRLAASIGDEQAARLYRIMARQVVDQVLDGDHRSVICYDPEDGEGEIRELFGAGPDHFRYQGDGDLGARMSRCLGQALSHSERAVVIGTDAPALNGAIVCRAFDALKEADLVLGPTFDGGYYLLGLQRPAPELFEGIVWSSPEVLEETVAKAARLGLRVTYLERLADVDTVDDLTPPLRDMLN